MKKTVSKMLGVIMALCIFLGVMPMSASAKEISIPASPEYKITEFSPKTKLEPSQTNNAAQFYSNGGQVDATRYFYNQLNANEKEIYEQILAAGTVQNIPLDMTNISFTGTGSTSQEAQNAMVAQITPSVALALTALAEDNPLFFWMGGFFWNNARLRMTQNTSSGTYTASLTSLTVVVNISTAHFADYDDVVAKRNAVVEKLETIKINGISRHEKLKSINDYLAANLTYDSTISEPNIFDPYGALVNGLCVCEGYAEAFKILCDREGIPCLTVVGNAGGAHKWNNVQMEDGEWYMMDSTWNDQSSNVFYSYFLIGNDTKAPYFSNSSVADSTVHIPEGKMYPDARASLVYPTLSNDTYSVGILQYDTEDVSVDKSRGCVLVGKDVSSYLYDFYSGGDYTRTRTGSGTTGTTLTLGDGVSTKAYTVAMRGDINADNTATADDYNLVVSTALAKYKVDENSASFYAGDMTQDGAIDGFDAVALDLYLEGTLVFD